MDTSCAYVIILKSSFLTKHSIFLAAKKNWDTGACSPRKFCYFRDQIVASGRFRTPGVPMPIFNVVLKSILFESKNNNSVAKESGDTGT